jgi:hypothetical protein
MAIFRLVNTFEGNTAGAVLPSAGVGSGSGQRSGNAFDRIGGGALVIADNSQAIQGTISAKINLGAANNSGGVGWNQVSIVAGATTAYARFYFRIESLPGNDARWIMFADSGGANVLGAVMLRTDGKFDLANTNLAVQATSTTTLTAGQWYRIEAKLVSHATAGSLEVKLFAGANVEGTVPDETVAFTNQNTNGNAMQFFNVGSTNGVTNFSMWVDAVELNSTGYPGSFAPPIPALYETLFANGTYPFMSPKATDDNGDPGVYTFGMYFTPSVDGKVYGAAWCNNNAFTSVERAAQVPQIALYPGPSGGATLLASKTTTVTEVRANWNYELFTSPIDVTAGTTYMIAVLRAGYPSDSFYFDAGSGGHGNQAQGNLTAQGVTGTDNNYFKATGGALSKPDTVFHSTWYGIDVLFQQNAVVSSQGYWGIPIS